MKLGKADICHLEWVQYLAQIRGGMTFLISFKSTNVSVLSIQQSSIFGKNVWKSYLLCTDSVGGFDHSVYTRIDDGYDAPFYVCYLPHHGLNLIDSILLHTLHLLKSQKIFYRCYPFIHSDSSTWKSWPLLAIVLKSLNATFIFHIKFQ